VDLHLFIFSDKIKVSKMIALTGPYPHGFAIVGNPWAPQFLTTLSEQLPKQKLVSQVTKSYNLFGHTPPVMAYIVAFPS
jgi:hypothetical protein